MSNKAKCARCGGLREVWAGMEAMLADCPDCAPAAPSEPEAGDTSARSALIRLFRAFENRRVPVNLPDCPEALGYDDMADWFLGRFYTRPTPAPCEEQVASSTWGDLSPVVVVVLSASGVRSHEWDNLRADEQRDALLRIIGTMRAPAPCEVTVKICSCGHRFSGHHEQGCRLCGCARWDSAGTVSLSTEATRGQSETTAPRPTPAPCEVTEKMIEAGARACWEVSRGDEKPWESATNIERVTFLDYSRLTLTAALHAGSR